MIQTRQFVEGVPVLEVCLYTVTMSRHENSKPGPT